MRVKHYLFFIAVFFFTFIGTAAIPDPSYYPLQIKYPETMIYKAETNEKVVALTFDDGPDERYTPQILDVLKKHHVKATFFLLVLTADKNPEVVKRLYEEVNNTGKISNWL